MTYYLIVTHIKKEKCHTLENAELWHFMLWNWYMVIFYLCLLFSISFIFCFVMNWYSVRNPQASWISSHKQAQPPVLLSLQSSFFSAPPAAAMYCWKIPIPVSARRSSSLSRERSTGESSDSRLTPFLSKAHSRTSAGSFLMDWVTIKERSPMLYTPYCWQKKFHLHSSLKTHHTDLFKILQTIIQFFHFFTYIIASIYHTFVLSQI